MIALMLLSHPQIVRDLDPRSAYMRHAVLATVGSGSLVALGLAAPGEAGGGGARGSSAANDEDEGEDREEKALMGERGGW